MYTVSDQTMRGILSALSLTWGAIQFDYDRLTPNEKERLSREDFEEVVGWIKKEGL